MALRRARNKKGSGELVLFADGPGLVVQGPKAEVAKFVEKLTAEAKRSGGRIRSVATDGLEVASQASSLASTHREYFELTPRARGLVEKHGLIPTGHGSFQGFVKHKGKFAGNLDWQAVNMAPQQALALQNMATHLALRAAINDLTAAVERVEGKIDKLVSLTRAERLGNAIGDRRTLQELVDHTRSHGRISQTDWSTVSVLGAQIARDLGALRAYILGEVDGLEAKPFLRTRSSELSELTDELLKESLALLVVVEHNYMLWQETRIANVASHEVDALPATIADAKSRLASITDADQRLVDILLGVARSMLKPTGYEGFLPREKQRLTARGEQLNELVGWFCDQRHLDSQVLTIEFPTLRESAAEAGSSAIGGLRAVASAARTGADKIRKGSPNYRDELS